MSQDTNKEDTADCWSEVLKQKSKEAAQQWANQTTTTTTWNGIWVSPVGLGGNCPSCGYCQHCGRGGHRPYFDLYRPWASPYWTSGYVSW